MNILTAAIFPLVIVSRIFFHHLNSGPSAQFICGVSRIIAAPVLRPLLLVLLPPVILDDDPDEMVGRLLDVGVLLGGGGKPAGEALLLAEGLHLGVVGHHAGHGLVALVPDQHAGDGAAVRQEDLGVQVLLPLFDGVERVHPGDVEEEEGADRVLVVDAGHVAESLLAGDVPQLQSDHGVGVPREDFKGKVHADGGAVVLREELVDVALYRHSSLSQKCTYLSKSCVICR